MFTANCFCMILASSLVAQSIPDRVSANGGKPFGLEVRGDTRGIPIEELVSADLIVRGKLVRPQSNLSNDKRNIWTTYTLLPSRVLVDRTHKPSVPGVTEPLMVTLYGGTVPVLGTTATMVDASLKRWTPGADVLVFLVKADDSGVKGYRPMGGASGVFEIASDERLVSLRREASDKQAIDGEPFDSVVTLITEVSKRSVR